ncbi:MAG TPA: STAS domain-containing protein [Candidatus Baltobacteraceae bacterium]|jgi:anti-anti-sigma factor|nr:STAS domain-containing protein [Candidatus Baltobacteraceae bacterium]
MQTGGERRVTLEGEYDLLRQAEVAEIFGSLPALKQLDLDFSAVTYVDSTFLGELARLHNRLPGCRISLTGANPNLKKIFDVVGFGQIFAIKTSESE